MNELVDSVEPRLVPERHPDSLLTRKQFCDWVGVPERTFTQWVTDGKGPKRLRMGRHVRIRWSDALAWAEARYVD